MKKIGLLLCLIFMLSLPAASYGFGVEIAGGAWYQSPNGDMSFDSTSNADNLDIRF